MSGQQTGRAQTRDLHQMRRADGSGAQDHLPAGSDVDDLAAFEQPQAGDAELRRGPGTATLILVDLVVHQKLHGLGLRVDGEIGSVCDGMQESIGHRPPTATPLVDMKVRTAGVVAPVELVDRGNAHLGGGGLPGVQDLPVHTRPLDADLTTGAVPVVGPAEVVLQLLVDGQRLSRTVRATPEPSFVSGGLRPQVVIASLTAHVDHGVDRRAAADHAAPRVVNAAAGQTRVGLGRQAPVGSGVGNCVQIAHRHLDPEPVIVAAGLNQEHTVIRVGAEPVGKQAARTACAHDDEVEFGDRAHAGIGPPWRRMGVPVCAITATQAPVPCMLSRRSVPPGWPCTPKKPGTRSGLAESPGLSGLTAHGSTVCISITL